jgi:hypothetical protein
VLLETDSSPQASYAGPMMKHRLLTLAIALSLATVVMTVPAGAQTNLNNRTLLTFSQPVEVPGKVLPAGTYTFELHEAQNNRHIVQIYDQAGTKLITTVLAMANRRGTPTETTVITFHEVPAGQPQALRAWFYPNQTVGHELAYPKSRAMALTTATVTVPAVDDAAYAVEVKTPVAAAAVEVTTPVVTPPVVTEPVVATPAVTATARVEATTPAAPVATVTTTPRRSLPRTASSLPMLVLFGVSTIGVGLAMRSLSSRRRTVR